MSKHGWVPVTPRGRALWDLAADKKTEAAYNATDCESRSIGYIMTWSTLKRWGWRVVKCYVGVDLGKN